MITGRTDCGLRYAVRRSGSAVAYCSLTIRVGTRDEEGFHSGIAHFTEHCLFKGTKRKTSAVINSSLERLGGELNAFTTKEEIVIHATVLKEDLRKAVDLLLELATQATFPEKEINIEKGVVIDEIKSYKDSPADDVYDRFEEMLFNGHPLSKPILGTVESVRKITSADLRRFVDEKFRPEAMALSIVADVDEKRLEKTAAALADKYFVQEISREAESECCGSTPSPERGFEKFNVTLEKRNYEVNAVIGSFAPSLYEEKERYATVLMGNIFAGSTSNSILNSILREKNGWVYSVEGSYTQYADSGVFAICLGCDRDNLDKCVTAVHKEIVKLQTIPFSEAKMRAAKKQLLGQLAIGSDNGEAECLSMGKSMMAFGQVSRDGEVKAKVEALTAEDIRLAACRVFNPETLSSLVFL